MPTLLQWTPNLVARFWDGVSSTRLDELSFSRLAGEPLLECLSEFLTPGKRVLDVGAGGGHLTEMLLARGCIVAVSEPSAERLHAIQTKPLAAHPGFLGFVDQYSSEEFDVVLAIEVIEHVLPEEMSGFMRLLRGKTKANGIVVVSTPNREDLELNMAYCPRCDALFHRWQHMRAFDPESLRKTMFDAGFERLRDHQLDFSHTAFAESRMQELEVKLKIAALIGPLYHLVKPFIERRAKEVDAAGTGRRSCLSGKPPLRAWRDASRRTTRRRYSEISCAVLPAVRRADLGPRAVRIDLSAQGNLSRPDVDDGMAARSGRGVPARVQSDSRQ